MRAGILTVSDRSAQRTREDAAGPALAQLLESHGIIVSCRAVVPDDVGEIKRVLVQWSDEEAADLIVTTGGTGLSPRDVTPEATLAVVDRTVPGMAEAMRAASMKITPHAMISRAVVGVRRGSLIVNLPGSPRGAVENLQVILPAVEHAIAKLQGDPSECASPAANP
ncbi:MAG: MogA/MoaB family molybdenum cofactor biosynthesis protein [Desulfomonile sp.]|nr:MogA/MoaB family molybdenum cofactor biosynthesis protein [Desulfomonile sp.]